MNKLNILNQSGGVIDQEDRETIHRDGLWHEEVHVWFYTPKARIIFQHRSKKKETWPDKLDATVGGHVKIAENHEEAAVRETKEETGIDVDRKKLEFIGVVQSKGADTSTGKQNNTFRAVYIYPYGGKMANLVLEKGKILGFKAWNINDLLNIADENKEKFVPVVFNENTLDIFRMIQKRIDDDE